MDQITTVPEQRGAGGKLRKPPPRKPPSTPYARPSSNHRWISKLVDPAYRIITDGATRFLPSFFSTPDSVEDQGSFLFQFSRVFSQLRNYLFMVKYDN